jgi:hypothetical protein
MGLTSLYCKLILTLMENSDLKKVAKNIFALTIFLFGIIYITHASTYAKVYSIINGGSFLVYLTAFVEMTIALSILSNFHIRKVCFIGGLYWLAVSTATLVIQLYEGKLNGDAEQINASILSFIISVGYASAILYVGQSEEE